MSTIELPAKVAITPAAVRSCVRELVRIRAVKKLEDVVDRCGLSLGVFAVNREIPFDDYFRQYGLSLEGFKAVGSSDFEWRAQWGQTDEEALQRYAGYLGVTPTWVPENLHVFEQIRFFFPQFGWRPVQKLVTLPLRNANRAWSTEGPTVQKLRRWVSFSNYPVLLTPGREAIQCRPSLFELLQAEFAEFSSTEEDVYPLPKEKPVRRNERCRYFG